MCIQELTGIQLSIYSVHQLHQNKSSSMDETETKKRAKKSEKHTPESLQVIVVGKVTVKVNVDLYITLS